jgi:hypothetical protein
MHIATKKEITGLNEDAVCIDYHTISVTYSPALSTVAALNVSPDNFKIFAPYVPAPPTLITLRTKTCSCLQRSTTVLDTTGDEIIPS